MSDQAPDPVDQFRVERKRRRDTMGGAGSLERLRQRGERSAREHIEKFCDSGTFREVGTFAHSANPEDAERSPGDGKIGGHALVDGRPVTVWADDITVKRASDSLVSYRKRERLLEQAFSAANPIVHFGQTGGARIPDTVGGVGFVEVNPGWDLPVRRRRVPVATAIVGDSFGGSSFVAAHSDFVVQVRGTTLAITSPRVIEIATGHAVTFEELGGVDVHAKRTGQIDRAAESHDEAYQLIRQFLSFMPRNIDEPPPQRPFEGSAKSDPGLVELIPQERRRGYDMRTFLRRLVDGKEFLELRPGVGRSLVTCLARLGGHPVGIVASNPMFGAGALDPMSIDKLVRLTTLCDSYGLPIVSLMDVPGVLVGKDVEHDRLLNRAMIAQQCLRLSEVPKISVVLRKAFGLAFYIMGGSDQGFDTVLAWPGAEIGFMDPEVAVNVLHADRLSGLGHDARSAELARLVSEMSGSSSVYGPAGAMKIDEIIDPAETRMVLVDEVTRYAGRPFVSGRHRPLSSWPTCI